MISANIDCSAHLAIVWRSSTRPIEHLSPKHCHLININQFFLAPILTCVSSFENSTSFYSSRYVFPSVPVDHIALQCQSRLCTRILYLLGSDHHEGHIIPLWHKNRGLLWNHHETGQHGQQSMSKLYVGSPLERRHARYDVVLVVWCRFWCPIYDFAPNTRKRGDLSP